MIDLRQRELADWQARNFPVTELLSLSKEELVKTILILQVTLGICEEAGEVAHHVLKGTQGIRGGINGINKAEVADGVSDVLIYGQQLLSKLEINAEVEIADVIEKVLQRDWRANPDGNGHGVPVQSA